MKKHRRTEQRLLTMTSATLLLAVCGLRHSFAQDVSAAVPTVDDITSLKIGVDTAWVMLTGFLVFFMQLGFAILEAGMVRQTATVNALLENFLEAGIGAILWWILGFGLAFGA